jgi:predicted DNA-binding ribbon-helix-helix protein
MAKDLKRSMSISGHRTSISLEPEFWSALAATAKADGKSLSRLVSEIDQARGERNLSSALRVWLLNRISTQR